MKIEIPTGEHCSTVCRFLLIGDREARCQLHLRPLEEKQSGYKKCIKCRHKEHIIVEYEDENKTE